MSDGNAPERPGAEQPCLGATAVQSFLVSPRIRRLSESSRRDKRSVLRRLAKWTGKDLFALSSDDIEQWLVTSPFTAGTRTFYLSHLNSFYAWAVEKGLVNTNPVTPLRCHRRSLEDHLDARASADDLDVGRLAAVYVADRLRCGEINALTARNVISVLERFVSVVGPGLAPSELEQEHVEEWLATRGHLAPATRRRQLSDVKGFCGWLARRRYVAVDPSAEVSRVRLPRYIPRALATPHVRDLLRHCPDARGRLIVLLMVEEGLRCCEVAAIQLHDINFHDRSVRISGKGGHERLLPITDETWNALGTYLSDRPATSGPLVRSYRETWAGLRPDTVSRMVSTWLGEARVKHRPRDGVSAHALRHTSATDMLRSGAHLRDVQAVLGHASLSTTQRYLPTVVHDLREAMGGRSYR